MKLETAISFTPGLMVTLSHIKFIGISSHIYSHQTQGYALNPQHSIDMDH